MSIAVVFGAERKDEPPVNINGLPVLRSDGTQINYNSRDSFRWANLSNKAISGPSENVLVEPRGFVPAPIGAKPPPFWQFSLFGSGIGASNILIGPALAGVAPEIIIGGNSRSDFGQDDFWQVLRRNAQTGKFDQIFVSPIYNTDPIYRTSIRRIGLANVVGDSALEIVVMLENGRIYLYDFRTKAELGYITTGLTDLQAMNLTDLNGDGRAELIVTTQSNLYVFNGNGALLWQVPEAGGGDVIAGQMDDDPALEIATTSGKVIDGATHAVQWSYSGGFGVLLRLAPITGKSYKQLIAAEGWQIIYAYDIAEQLPRWSINTPQDIGAIEVADVDNNGTPELIIGDGQWGTIHVHDLGVQSEKWHTGNPYHGVTSVAVGDVDADGVPDLLWGAGWSDTGPDYLYIARTNGNHAIKWQSADLVGPFVGPAIGDLDGDGKPELVVCSFQSESGYGSGRILVFDLATLTLRGMSAPVVENVAWTGVHDLKVRDVEGDGRAEIIIAADYLYDGAIEIYSFSSANTFTRKWINTSRPSGSPFNFVEVADLNGNGHREIIATNTVAHSGSEGLFVRIYDYPSASDPWRSVSLGPGFSSVAGLVVQDLDGNGSKEIAALAQDGDLYTFDGPSRELKDLRQGTHGAFLSSRSNPAGLVLADTAGAVHFLQYANADYAESLTRIVHAPPLSGINVLSGNALCVGAAGSLSLRQPPTYNAITWQSQTVGDDFGRFVVTDIRNGSTRLFSSARHAVVGVSDAPAAPRSVQALNVSARSTVATGENVLIGGFVITGSLQKKVIVRAIGPSLAQAGVHGALGNPTLDLYSGKTLIARNDDWKTTQQAVIAATGFPPKNNLEAAIVRTLDPGAYTAIVRGVNGSGGTALVEVYDLSPDSFSKLANISARSLVGVSDNVMIGGFVVGSGTTPTKVVVRGIGPSLVPFGVHNALGNPLLELHNANGALVAVNDNWKDTQRLDIQATGLAPSNDLEAAMVRTLSAGPYTAIVRGKGNSTGVGLVEIYVLN